MQGRYKIWFNYFTLLMLVSSCPLNAQDDVVLQRLSDDAGEVGVAILPVTTVEKVQTLVDGLTAPDGLALHPKYGFLFVSEEYKGKISQVRDGKTTRVISPGTPLYSTGKKSQLFKQPLRNPEGIALDAHANLYVVEDVPGGRLLYFERERLTGDYPVGEVVRIPGDWSCFAWENVAIDEKGRILMAGSNGEWLERSGHKLLPTGMVLFRDTEERWWAALQSLSSSFSDVAFVPGTDCAVFTCEISGMVGWINLEDAGRHMGISKVKAFSPEGICILPNGHVIVAEEGGTLLSVDPAKPSYHVVVEGLGTVESVVWDDHHERLLVTEDEKGRLLSLALNVERHGEGSRLAQADWWENEPQPIPDLQVEHAVRKVFDSQAPGAAKDFSLSTEMAFVENIPLVALDVVLHQVEHGETPADPITRLEFVLLNPRHTRSVSGVAPESFASIIATTAAGKTYEMKATNMVARVEETSPFEGVTIDGAGNKTRGGPRPPWAKPGTMTVHFLGHADWPAVTVFLNHKEDDKCFLIVGPASEPATVYRLEKKTSKQWTVAYADRHSSVWSIMALPQ